MKKFLFLFVIVLSFTSYSQATSDSLWSIWEDPNAYDTARLESLNKYIWAEYLFYDPDSAFILAQAHYDFAKEKGLEKYMGQALSTQGVSFAVVGNSDSALVFYEKSLHYFEKANYKKGIASIANNMGVIYYNQGKIQKGIDSYILSMKMMQELGNTKAVAKAQSNIGLVYMDKGNYTQAIDYFNLSYKNAKRISETNGMINALNNIAILYDNIAEYEKAIEYFKQSLELIDENTENNLALKHSLLNNIGTTYSNLKRDDLALNYYMQSLAIKMELGIPYEIALTLNNIGTIYLEMDSLDVALNYFERSKRLYEENDEMYDIVTTFNNIAEVKFREGKYSEAKKFAKRSLALAMENEVLSDISFSSQLLYKVYKKENRTKLALEMLELHENAEDSLLSEKNQREVIGYSFKHEYEKKVAADSLKALESKIKTDAQLATQEAQIEKERIQRFTLYGGLGILILFGGFMFNRFKITQKQKSIIESQRDKVESQRALLGIKNKEIVDSIVYAKRIQSAILPPSWMLQEYLPNSFVIYRPKDVVAGDFYWLRKVEDRIFFAVADCTGHGVPGAMVSVVCNNALNRSIREYGLIEPGQILDKTREIVLKEFEKADDEVNDGMDIALCSIRGNTLSYAGANNPLWIIRNNELLITKANKQPIGKYINPKPYMSHHIALQDGDSVYVFSDGMADQFGGPLGKKYKLRAFQKLILSLQNKEMQEQKLRIEEAFKNWKGDLEQVDDICIIGYKHA